jgi:hypothetical protein
MVKKINYGKIVAVVLITVLIWIWADLALEDEFSVSSGIINVAKSTRPNLWVSFNDEPSVSIAKIVLKGPASKIADAKRKLKEGPLAFEFFLDPEQEQAMVGPDKLDVITFLRQSDRIRQLGLTVKSCDPNTLSVNVVELVKRPLPVKSLNEDQNLIKGATIEPPQVDMFVPEDWEGAKLEAKVSLTRSEINQARLSAIEKIPYIELAPGQARMSPTPVKITTPPEPDQLEDHLITATLSIALSPTLQGKYRVEVTNLNAVMSAIAIRATPEAKRAYELQPFPPMTLYILDDDKKSTDEQKRKLVYNFPEEFVRNDEIKLKGQPVEARFKLIPLPSVEAQ